MSASREGCCATWPGPCQYHEGWQDAADAVLARLHRPFTLPVLDSACYDERCINPEHDENGCPEHDVVVCAECHAIAEDANDEAPIEEHLIWPCATARALGVVETARPVAT